MSTASPITNSASSDYETSSNLISIGLGLPFLQPGDSIFAISADGANFTSVPPDGTGAVVDGTFLSFNVTDTGDATISPFQTNQALIDQINANRGNAAPLTDSLFYDVTTATGTAEYEVTYSLGDIGIQTTDNAPFSTPETVSTGTTTPIPGITVVKGLSTGQTDNSADTLSVSVGLFDFAAQAPDGTLSIDPAVSGGGGTVTQSPDGASITIDGTISQINADLSTLGYTAVNAGTDAVIVTFTDSPTPTANNIVGNIVAQASATPIPVANTAATIFEVQPDVYGSGQGAPFVASGDTVVGISTDDINFTPVPPDGSQASVTGTDLTFSLDDAGNLNTTTAQPTQSLIDAINANDGATTPLTEAVYYQVQDGQVQDGAGSTVVNEYVFNLGDTAFGAPGTVPYSSPATITQGTTIDIGGATIAKALSSDGTYGGTDPTAYTLSVSIGVFDFARQAADGTVSLDPTVSGGGGGVSYGTGHGSVTVVGTINQINADLASLTYTAVNTGTDFIDISVIDGPVPSANQIIGSILVDAAATCFCAGTLIGTPDGEVAVEALRIGDLVSTPDGAAPVKWLGHRRYAGAFIAGQHLMLPVCFRAGSLGAGMPRQDLHVSPGHGMLVDGCLVPAWRLVNGVSVTQASAVEEVTYYHVELDRHAVLLANGTAAESFLDDGCRGQFHNAADFHSRYPGAAAPAPFAARVEDGFALQAVQARVALRAGLDPQIEPVGALRGFVDAATPERVCGWAQDCDSLEESVWLEIRVGGHPAVCVLANAYRADLRQAGFGSGCHAFDAALPQGLAGEVVVRRAADGALLAQTVEARRMAA